MSTIQEQKARIIAEAKERVAKAREEAELAKLAVKYGSNTYVKLELQDSDNKRLDSIISAMEDVLSSVKRKPSYIFGYGSVVDKVMTIVRTARFAPMDVKDQIVALSGTTESVIENLANSWGNTAYFSPEAMEVVPAVDMDIPAVEDYLDQIASDLDIASDIPKIIKSKVDYQYAKALAKAETALTDTLKYAQREDIVYEE